MDEANYAATAAEGRWTTGGACNIEDGASGLRWSLAARATAGGEIALQRRCLSTAMTDTNKEFVT